VINEHGKTHGMSSKKNGTFMKSISLAFLKNNSLMECPILEAMPHLLVGIFATYIINDMLYTASQILICV
jgi:hypothetical protein